MFSCFTILINRENKIAKLFQAGRYSHYKASAIVQLKFTVESHRGSEVVVY